MLSLTIYHNIHLSRQQRFALHSGEEVEATGMSVPVWLEGQETSEPAREVFCRYRLKNPHRDMPIRILADGYEISLPFREGTSLQISNNDWRHLNQKNPAKLDALYQQMVQEVSSANLLDTRDGGSGFLFYREHNRMSHQGQTISVLHFVSIGTMEELVENISASQLGAIPQFQA